MDPLNIEIEDALDGVIHQAYACVKGKPGFFLSGCGQVVSQNCTWLNPIYGGKPSCNEGCWRGRIVFGFKSPLRDDTMLCHQSGDIISTQYLWDPQ